MRYLIQCSLKRVNFQTRILTTMGHGLMVPKSRKIFSPRSVFQLTKQTHFENHTGLGNRVKVMSRVSRLIFFCNCESWNRSSQFITQFSGVLLLFCEPIQNSPIGAVGNLAAPGTGVKGQMLLNLRVWRCLCGKLYGLGVKQTAHLYYENRH